MHSLKTKSKTQPLRCKPPLRSAPTFSTTARRLTKRTTPVHTASSAPFSVMHHHRIQRLNLADPLPPNSDYHPTIITGKQFTEFCKLPESLPDANLKHLDIAVTTTRNVSPPSTVLELFAIHRGGLNSSTLLRTISKLSTNPDIVDVVTNAFYQPHTNHMLPPPHKHLYHYETRQWVCDNIQKRPIDPVIVDQTFEASLGLGHNDFAPSNLRIVQPAFVPLLCAMDQAIQDFFTKPKEVRKQSQKDNCTSDVAVDAVADSYTVAPPTPTPTAPKPMNEMCQAIFNPPKPSSNLFVFSGPAGLGKTEMLKAGLHRAALMGKNVLLVTPQNAKVLEYSIIDFASSAVRTMQTSCHQHHHENSAGNILLQLFSDISDLLETYCTGQEVMVLVDPPEFTDPTTKFDAFNDFIQHIEPFGDQHDGTFFAYEKLYSMLSEQHPNAFFLAAHSASLPRPGTLLTQKQPMEESTDFSRPKHEEKESTLSEGGPALAPSAIAVSGPCVPLRLMSFPHFRFPGLRLTQSTMDKTTKLMLLATHLDKQKKKTAKLQESSTPELPQSQQLSEVPQSSTSTSTPSSAPLLKTRTKSSRKKNKGAEPAQLQLQSSTPATINSMSQSIDAASSVDLSKLDEFLYPHVSEPALAVLLRRVVPLDYLGQCEQDLFPLGVHGAFTCRAYFAFLSYTGKETSNIVKDTSRLAPWVTTRHQLVLPKTGRLVPVDLIEEAGSFKRALIKLFTSNEPPRMVHEDKLAPPYDTTRCVPDNGLFRHFSTLHDFNDSLDRPTTTLSCYTQASGYYPCAEGAPAIVSKGGARPKSVIQSMLRCPSKFNSFPKILVRGNIHSDRLSNINLIHKDFPPEDRNGGHNDDNDGNAGAASSTWSQYHKYLAASGGQGTFIEVFPSNGSATYRIGDDSSKLLTGQQIARLYGLGRDIAIAAGSSSHTDAYNNLMDLGASSHSGLNLAVIDEDSKKFYGIHALDDHVRPEELSGMVADYENLCKLHVDIINTGIVKGGEPKSKLRFGGMIHLTQHDTAGLPRSKNSKSRFRQYTPSDVKSLFKMEWI